MLNINLEFIRGILFVRLKGALTQITADKLNDTLIPIIINNGIKNLVYNINELKSIDEIGKKILLMGNNAVLNNKGKVLMVNNKFDIENIREISSELVALDILKV